VSSETCSGQPCLRVVRTGRRSARARARARAALLQQRERSEGETDMQCFSGQARRVGLHHSPLASRCPPQWLSASPRSNSNGSATLPLCLGCPDRAAFQKRRRCGVVCSSSASLSAWAQLRPGPVCWSPPPSGPAAATRTLCTLAVPQPHSSENRYLLCMLTCRDKIKN